MDLMGASLLPLAHPALAVSTVVWALAQVPQDLRFDPPLWSGQMNQYSIDLELERLRLVHSMRCVWEEVRKTRL